jgi:hypothetical protein
MTTLPPEQRQAAVQLRRTRPSKPARFRRDPDSDYPVGYLAQLARPLLSRKDAKSALSDRIRRPPPEASAP